MRPSRMANRAGGTDNITTLVLHCTNTGAGAGARQSLGTTVVFGMLFATMIGIFVIPVFFVVIQRISERRWPQWSLSQPPG